MNTVTLSEIIRKIVKEGNSMMEDIINSAQLFANIATVIAVVIAIYSIKENIASRKTSIRPLLIPGRITEFFSDDNLFSCNYEYPISDDIGTPFLVHFGIRNIGKGAAKNARVIRFESEEKDPITFRVGYNSVSIPEGESIPFVIRIARKDPLDYYFITYSTTIYYEDIFGGKFYISVRIWIQESGVIVLEYKDTDKAQWREFMTVVSREVESYGYFEMRKLEDEIKGNKIIGNLIEEKDDIR